MGNAIDIIMVFALIVFVVLVIPLLFIGISLLRISRQTGDKQERSIRNTAKVYSAVGLLLLAWMIYLLRSSPYDETLAVFFFFGYWFPPSFLMGAGAWAWLSQGRSGWSAAAFVMAVTSTAFTISFLWRSIVLTAGVDPPMFSYMQLFISIGIWSLLLCVPAAVRAVRRKGTVLDVVSLCLSIVPMIVLVVLFIQDRGAPEVP